MRYLCRNRQRTVPFFCSPLQAFLPSDRVSFIIFFTSTQEREDVADKKHIKKHKLKKFDVEAALLQQLHKDVKGSTRGSPFMLVELDDEIRRMNNDEYINKHKVFLWVDVFYVLVLFVMRLYIMPFGCKTISPSLRAEQSP